MVKNAFRWGLVVALAGILAMPIPALATHMSDYRFMATERDDQGRVLEPDGATTDVLGTPLENCVIALNPNAIDCTPDSLLPAEPPPQCAGCPARTSVAPGCTDASGFRRMSGECGFETSGMGIPGPAGVIVPVCGNGHAVDCPAGVTTGSFPGRFNGDAATVSRFLDSKAIFQYNGAAVMPSQYIEINRKLDDNGVYAALDDVDPDFGQDFAPHFAALWAWYGRWTDKNGNGVIDMKEGQDVNAQGRCGPDGCVDATNEFVWIGRCLTFEGTPAAPGNRFCTVESVSMPIWIYPGNHHSICFGFGVILVSSCPSGTEYTWGDFPGDLAICLLNSVASNNLVWPCEPDLERQDEFDQNVRGDPILGIQNSIRIDGVLGDRTGDADIGTRHWTFGGGWSSKFYDQSLLTSTVIVTGVTPQQEANEALPTWFDLGLLESVDVDSYSTWSPEAHDLLNTIVKPTARSQYLLVRNTLIPIQKARDAIENNRIFYDECDTYYLNIGCPTNTHSGVVLGQTFTRYFDAGWAHEPNYRVNATAGDVFPGATFQTLCSGDSTRVFFGWCNDYSGYASNWHAWLEVQGFPAIYDSPAWKHPATGRCINCVVGPPSALPDLGSGRLKDPGDYSKTLQPGTFVFLGVVGAWKDRVQAHFKEQVIDVEATVNNVDIVYENIVYDVGPDGWVGDIVNTTGAVRSRGYGPEVCDPFGVAATYEYAQCHPYRDGNRADSNDYTDSEEFGGEFRFAKNGVGGNPNINWNLKVRPADGTWNVPVFIWRHFTDWRIGRINSQEGPAEFTGTTGTAAVININMGSGAGVGGTGSGGLNAQDVLILPEGNLDEPVITEVCGRVIVDAEAPYPAVDETACDYDFYAAWGPNV